MLRAITTKRFNQDLKLAKKRGKELEKLRKLMELLISKQKLSEKYRDHSLRGDYVNYRECHIEPDWLLIYKIEKDSILFARTGSHSDLFD